MQSMVMGPPLLYDIDFFKLITFSNKDGILNYTFEMQTEECTRAALEKKLTEAKHINYRRFDKASQTYIAQLQGQRGYLEDRVDCGPLPDFKNIPANYRPIVLKEVVQTLQARLVEQKIHLKSGTTCLLMLMCEKTLIVANVGDSRGSALIFNNKTKKERSLCLNESRHNTNAILWDDKSLTPLQCLEKERLQRFAQLHTKYSHEKNPSVRFQHEPCLNVSRTLGDETQKKDGLINVPDIIVHTLAEDEIAAVFAFSDATDETLGYDNENFLKWFSTLSRKFTPTDMNKLVLALAADPVFNGAKDNHAVAGTLYDPKTDAPKWIALYDGHINAEAAAYLCEITEAVLHEKTKEMLQEQEKYLHIHTFYHPIETEITEMIAKIDLKNRAIRIFDCVQQFMPKENTDHKFSDQDINSINSTLFTIDVIVSIRNAYDSIMPETTHIKEPYPDRYGFSVIYFIEDTLTKELQKYFYDKSTPADQLIETMLNQLFRIITLIPNKNFEALERSIKNALCQLLDEFPWYMARKILRNMDAKLLLSKEEADQIEVILTKPQSSRELMKSCSEFIVQFHQTQQRNGVILCDRSGVSVDFIVWLSKLEFSEEPYFKELLATLKTPIPPATTATATPSPRMRSATS